MSTTQITIETTVQAPVEKVWDRWTLPEHITKWNAASDDWHTPHATNDVRPGGTFTSRMEAKDGSVGFDFGGTYDDVQKHKHISYTMGDGRRVSVEFDAQGDSTKIVETFDAESQNSVELQRSGWQSILDNFKRYAEAE